MRVVIAEDLALLREGLVRLLEDGGLEVVAAVDNGSDLLRAIVVEKPDVAVVDVRLPPEFRGEGLRAAIEARRRRPGFPVLVLSQYVEQAYASGCSRTATARSATSSRNGSATSATSSPRCGGSRRAAPRSTRRSFGSSSRVVGRSTCCRRASARCSPCSRTSARAGEDASYNL